MSRRPVLRASLSVILVLAVPLGIIGCSKGSSTAPTTTSTTTTMRTGPPTVTVLGDGVASAALPSVAGALGATAVIDRSVPRSSAVSWLDLRDPAAPDEGSNHDALVATLRDAPSFVLVSLGTDVTAPTGRVDPILRQRVMAVVFDLLARTIDTRVVVVGSGGPPGSAAATVDAEQAAAVSAVGEAGASWARRAAFAPSPVDVVAVLQQREWV